MGVVLVCVRLCVSVCGVSVCKAVCECGGIIVCVRLCVGVCNLVC